MRLHFTVQIIVVAVPVNRMCKASLFGIHPKTHSLNSFVPPIGTPINNPVSVVVTAQTYQVYGRKYNETYVIDSDE